MPSRLQTQTMIDKDSGPVFLCAIVRVCIGAGGVTGQGDGGGGGGCPRVKVDGPSLPPLDVTTDDEPEVLTK